MHKWVAGTRICIQHLLSVMLPSVFMACSFSSTYYAPSAHFPLHIPLTPLAFSIASASSASFSSSACYNSNAQGVKQ